MDVSLPESGILDLLQVGTAYLQHCGVPDPRVEADLLLAHVLGRGRAQLYLEAGHIPTAEQLKKYEELLRRRGARVPFAYLVKAREFMGLSFYVDERVLIPRPETELLVEKGLERKGSFGPAPRILDICTGSGAIGLSVAHYWPEANVTLSDLSSGALGVAEINAERLGIKARLVQGDLFQPFQKETFDIILANPPYVSATEYEQCSPEVRQEPFLALVAAEEGLALYRRIVQEGLNRLSPVGLLMMEIGSAQGAKIVSLLTEQGLEPRLYQDYAGLDRIVLAQKPR